MRNAAVVPLKFPDAGAYKQVGGAGGARFRVTVSIRRMSLGTGFAYLMGSVVRGDGAVARSSPLTRYYAESGTPPGRWLGAGLAGLADGAGLVEGSEVTEEQLWRVLGMLADPVTGQPLGHRPRHWPTPLRQRITARVEALPAGLGVAEKAAAVAVIEAEEQRREARVTRPVAAFDLTFSVPKSVSTVWAVADAATQEAIYTAHRDAITIALTWAEQQVVFTRTGHNGAFQEPVRGIVAAAFDHWDSRAGDPHLHTHVVVANRVQTLDGRWRTLDSKTLHRYTVALSELHEGVLQDLLSDRLGYGWTAHARRHSPVPRWDLSVADAQAPDWPPVWVNRPSSDPARRRDQLSVDRFPGHLKARAAPLSKLTAGWFPAARLMVNRPAGSEMGHDLDRLDQEVENEHHELSEIRARELEAGVLIDHLKTALGSAAR